MTTRTLSGRASSKRLPREGSRQKPQTAVQDRPRRELDQEDILEHQVRAVSPAGEVRGDHETADRPLRHERRQVGLLRSVILGRALADDGMNAVRLGFFGASSSGELSANPRLLYGIGSRANLTRRTPRTGGVGRLVRHFARGIRRERRQVGLLRSVILGRALGR